jgi:hypothetical protein
MGRNQAIMEGRLGPKISDSVVSNQPRRPLGVIQQHVGPITVGVADGVPYIDIFAPPRKGRPKDLVAEVRGLLRKLEEDPEAFSRLYPLYVEDDSQQQWLLHPGNRSTQHRNADNYPLPPRGNTFVMDMIGVPFSKEAFTPEDYKQSKMLVTGGGVGIVYPGEQTGSKSPYCSTVHPAGDACVPNWVFGSDAEYNICPRRAFKVGRKGVMPGWPWRDVNGVSRLVSVSAVMVHYDATYYRETKAEFYVEFLKLSGQPFASDENGYLEPIAIDVYDESDDDYLGVIEDPFWYDFSVISLTPRGNKAVLALHQAGYRMFQGVPMDFLVLDLEAEENQVQYISRYDHFRGEVSGFSYSTSGQIKFPTIGSFETYSFDPPIPGRSWVRPVLDMEGQTSPSSSTLSYSSEVDITYAFVFDAHENLVRRFVRITSSESATVQLSVQNISKPSDDKLGNFLDIPQWLFEAEYVIGSLVIVDSQLYLCIQNHTATFDNRPFITVPLNSSTIIQGNPAYWRFVYGMAATQLNCQYQTWNGFTFIPNEPEEDEDPCTPEYVDRHLSSNQYGIIDGFPCPILWMSLDGGARAIFHTGSAGTALLHDGTDNRESVMTGQLEFFAETQEGEVSIDVVPFSSNVQRVNRRRVRLGAGTACVRGFMWPDNVHRYYARYEDTTPHALQQSVFGVSESIALPTMPAVCNAAWLTHVGTGSFNLFVSIPESSGLSPDPSSADNVYWGGCEWLIRTLVDFMKFGVWPLHGIGNTLFGSAENHSFTHRVCVFPTPYIEYKDKYVPAALTYQSMAFSVDYDGVVDETYHILFADILGQHAACDPGPYVYGEDAPNDGLVLKPVIGPEKGSSSAEQRIAYVGWLYPEELESDD